MFYAYFTTPKEMSPIIIKPKLILDTNGLYNIDARLYNIDICMSN
jgi:hypothetical protein